MAGKTKTVQTQQQAKEALLHMNLIQNFLFTKVLSREECKEEVSRILFKPMLGRIPQHIRVDVEHVSVGTMPGKHGMRLDILVREYAEQNVTAETIPQGIYDFEAETRMADKPDLPKRARYYRASIDHELLPAGTHYKKMPKSYIIFVMNYDPFGCDRMVYTVKNRCLEEPELEYDDGAVNLYLYCNGKKGEVRKELKELLKYMGDSRQENAVNDDLKRLHKIVDDTRNNKEVSKEYMKWFDYEESIREEGREEGREVNLISLVQKKLRKGKDADQIADDLEESVDDIRDIIRAIQFCGTDSSPADVYTYIHEQSVRV